MTNKIKDILKTHKYLLLSFFLPVLLLEGIAIAEKIQPFGSESFLIVDALHQYLPFFADYQEKLKSMDSMFYSFHAGLGYNFLGLWAYYLASPLNLVIALVSKSMPVSYTHLDVYKRQVGKNGAGKSTTIRLIMDMIHKDSGTIYVLGKNIEEDFTERCV